MLSRLFSRGGSDHRRRHSSGSGSQQHRSRMGFQKSRDTGVSEESKLGAVKKGMDEEHFASGVSKEKAGMTDKLNSYRTGQTFKYAVISNAPSEERSGIMSRLRSYKAPSKQSPLSLSEIPAIRLLGEAVSFSMVEAVRSSGTGGREDYCLIDSVLVHYVPLDSFLNDKSVVTIQVNDFRKVTGTAVRIAKVDNTMAYNVLFCLDYCVESRDLDKMTLSFACPQRDFQEGVAWGAVKVVAQVAFMSFPIRAPVIETMAVAVFADTDLLEYEWDPREVDAVIGPQALSGLRAANKRGDIENLTQPKDDRVEVGMARSVMVRDVTDEAPSDIIDSMKRTVMNRVPHASPKTPRSTQPAKSALKKPGISSPPASPVEAWQEGLADVELGESISDDGESIDEDEVNNAAAAKGKITRFQG